MATLGNPQNTIAVLQKYKFNFQKKFGQNFLIDTHVLDKIIDAAGITKEDFVLEIGPGIGTMTQYLCENAREVVAVEIDKNLIPILEDTLSDYRNVTVINQDILKLDIPALAKEKNDGKPIKVVANLPYYITTPIIMGLFESHVPIESITIMVQKEVADRIKIYQHDCLAEDLVHVGDTSRGTPVWIDKHVADADKVIITGGITVHLMAGFGGGRKSILPGVAGDETIQKNHALALADEVGSGISQETRTTLIDHNRLNDDMCEAAALVNPCFLVNSVMDTNGDFARIVAGHWYDAWLEGTKEVMKIQGVKVKGQADVVIASPGGFPKDINLYQGSKTYDTAEMALKPGGIVISLLEAREINDPPEYMQSFHFNDVIEMEKAVRNKFTIPFFIAYRLFLLCQNSTVYIVTRKENFDTVKKTGQIPVETLEEAWSLAQKQLAERGLKDYTVNIMQHAANTVPMID